LNPSPQVPMQRHMLMAGAGRGGELEPWWGRCGGPLRRPLRVHPQVRSPSRGKRERERESLCEVTLYESSRDVRVRECRVFDGDMRESATTHFVFDLAAPGTLPSRLNAPLLCTRRMLI
jgi:hypothetical protein